jgi:hypothetical protein
MSQLLHNGLCQYTVRSRRTAQLSDWYRQRIRQERTQGLKGALRRESFQHITAEREKDRTARVEREREERRRVRAAYAIPNWQGYLEAEAAKGNEQALAALRSGQRRTRQLENDVLTAEDADRARHIVHGHMRPAVRRNGRVIYRVADGGIVSDEADQVRVPQPTAAATVLALSLAADRFGARPLIVGGTDTFRKGVVKAADISGLSIVFADPALEQLRARQNGQTQGADEQSR